MNDRLKQIQTLLDENPEDDFLTYALAKQFESQGNLQKALVTYLELKKRSPEYEGLYYHLGKLYEELDLPEKAMTVYNEGIEICKKKSDFHALSELNNAKINLEMEL